MKSFLAIKYIVLLIFCLSASACESTRIAKIGSQPVFVTDSDEARLWKRTEELQGVLLQSGYIDTDKELNAYLNGLLDKIVPQEVKNSGVSPQVYVLQDASFNAFMLANGSMFIHYGLLASLENEAQLITVMGHELCHFVERHSLKSFRNIKNMSAFYSTIGALSIAAPAGAFAGLSNLIISVGFLSSVCGYSKDMERQADKWAFETMVKNKYDISQSRRAFEILAQYIKDDKIKEPYFFSTHPRIKERIENFKDLSAEQKRIDDSGTGIINEDIYNNYIETLLLPNAICDIKCNRFNAAKRAIDRYIKTNPMDPDGFYSMGKLYNERKKEGDSQKAIEYFQKALEFDSEHTLTLRDLGFLYYKQNDDIKAKESFEKYLALASDADDAAYVRKYLENLKTKRKEP